MKVAFDQHVPSVLARTFSVLANEKVIQKNSKGLIFQTAHQYAPEKTDKDYIQKSDVPWLDRFAKAGGRAIISGDVKMRERHHECLALYNHGFVTIFFERSWNGWSFYRKSALLLHWWEEVCTKIKTAERGTFWVIPAQWPTFPGKPGELRNVSLGLAKLLRDRPTQSQQQQPTKPKKKPKNADQLRLQQPDLFEGAQPK